MEINFNKTETMELGLMNNFNVGYDITYNPNKPIKVFNKSAKMELDLMNNMNIGNNQIYIPWELCSAFNKSEILSELSVKSSIVP